jgi:RluA family pseudouridine synthase
MKQADKYEPRMVRRTIIVKPPEAGQTLLERLVNRFTYFDREGWQDQINRKRLLLNDNPCRGTEPLCAGDTITWFPPERPEPPVNRDIAVLYRDDDYLFVDKPGDLPCHPGGIYLFNTLWGILREMLPATGGQGFSLINRLDRETSGIVAVALTKKASGHAFNIMKERLAIKEYRVLVEGDFPDALDARGWLLSDRDSPIRKKMLYIPDPEAAEETLPEPGSRFVHTRFSRLEARDDGTTLLAAELLTGRTHQIRATLHSLGFPVVGDKLYGIDPEIFLRFPLGRMTERDKGGLRLGRQALHCSRMCFPAFDGRILDIRSLPRETWGLTTGGD